MEQPIEKARKKYEGKREIKHVSFNTETEADLLALANTLNFSQWVKDKLREEMARR